MAEVIATARPSFRYYGGDDMPEWVGQANFEANAARTPEEKRAVVERYWRGTVALVLSRPLVTLGIRRILGDVGDPPDT